jgi:glycosyltransferase involved in cell wall biosynthesis
MKKVLIAHQSTIPHYRIPFYNTLEELRPAEWKFDVVFDLDRRQGNNFLSSDFDLSRVHFPLLKVDTYSIKFNQKIINYQTFIKSASKYNVLVLENALNNLAYPISHIYRTFGKKIIYWGHGKHKSDLDPSIIKPFLEYLKINLVKKADGFFAYSDGVKSYVVSQGMPVEKVFTLHNTIDILEQRSIYEKYKIQRDKFREKLNVEEKNVLLFVGRFSKNKRIDFLLESFSHLNREEKNFHLFLVGGGGSEYLMGNHDGITYLGPIFDVEELSAIYIASDLFIITGSVGLGPLQALCYDLPVVAVDAPTHGPEYEYLNDLNSIILPETSTSVNMANEIHNLFTDPTRLRHLKSNTWNSIKHLTIENMAKNFIHGINSVLNLPNYSSMLQPD